MNKPIALKEPGGDDVLPYAVELLGGLVRIFAADDQVHLEIRVPSREGAILHVDADAAKDVAHWLLAYAETMPAAP
jgi:hypothetical protein